MSHLISKANALIPPPLNEKVLAHKAGETRDIIKEVLACYKDNKGQLKKFAPYLKGADFKSTCSNIWHFWKQNINYKVDADGVQHIKSPAAVWSSKFCDCKSFSVAVAATLHALGYAGKFRFTSYGSNTTQPTHVYVVAMHAGKEVIIDCVWTGFNSQKRYTKNWDYNMTAIYRISGLETRSTKGQLYLPDGVTHAELELGLDKQQLELEQTIIRKKHGANTPLDDAYQTEIEAHVAAIGFLSNNRHLDEEEISGIGNPGKKAARKKAAPKKAATKKTKANKVVKAGDTVKKRKTSILKKVGTGIKKGLVKFNPLGIAARLAIKTQLPKSAPFFLYLFLNPLDNKLFAALPDAVKVKRNKALKYKDTIVKKLQLKEANFLKIVRNGIMDKYAKSPEEVLAQWMREQNFKIGFVAEALGMLKKLLGSVGEKMQSDVEAYSPVPEDWAGKELTKELKEAIAVDTQENPGNNDPTTGKESIKVTNPTTGEYIVKTSTYEAPKETVQSGGGSSSSNETRATTKEVTAPEDGRKWEQSDKEDEPKGETNLSDAKTLETVTVTAPPKEEKSNSTMLLLGLGAVALLAMSGKKRK